MNGCDDFITRAKKELPELCSTKDLVRFGLYSSEQCAYNARKNGIGFDYFKLPHGHIVYPKNGIIQQLENSKHSGITHENYDTGRSYSQGSTRENKKGIRL